MFEEEASEEEVFEEEEEEAFEEEEEAFKDEVSEDEVSEDEVSEDEVSEEDALSEEDVSEEEVFVRRRSVCPKKMCFGEEDTHLQDVPEVGRELRLRDEPRVAPHQQLATQHPLSLCGAAHVGRLLERAEPGQRAAGAGAGVARGGKKSGHDRRCGTENDAQMEGYRYCIRGHGVLLFTRYCTYCLL